jgi:hypothetical protein
MPFIKKSDRKAEPLGFGFSVAGGSLGGRKLSHFASGDEMKDERDEREDEEDMNQKRRDVKEEETARPRKNQDHCQK